MSLDEFQWGFNGATAIQPWIVVEFPVAPGWAYQSFNGATAIQPWIGRILDQQDFFLGVFQWGHGYSAMDREMDKTYKVEKVDVSMGPRLFSHG